EVNDTLTVPTQPATPRDVETSSTWDDLWQDENRRVTLRHVRTLCLIAMVLVPTATLLDRFAYPNLVPHFALVRSLVAVIEMLLLGLSYTIWGQKHHRLLMLLVPLVPAISIAWMIFKSGDPGSPY